jgi:predicted nucleic acid-binding Zn ribbon protein
MSRSNQFSLGEAIREFIREYDLQDKLNEKKILASWENVVGPVISKHTSKMWIRNGVLYVRLDSAALRNELMYSRTKILRSMNRKAGSEVLHDMILK